MFSKDSLDELKIIERFTDIRLKEKLSAFINNNVKNPSDDFVKYVAKSSICAEYDESSLPRYRLLITSIMGGFIPVPPQAEESPIINRVELQAYEITKDILREYSSDVQYKKYKSYFTVNQAGSMWRWIIRVKCLYDGSIRICFPINYYNKHEWVTINNVEELRNMGERIISSFKMATSF